MNQLTVAAHNQKLELWIERIRACRSSGMSVTDWCGANNIGSKSYYYWMRKIKQEAFDSLPGERKSRASLNPLTSEFAEVPIPKLTPCETIRVDSVASKRQSQQRIQRPNISAVSYIRCVTP